MDKLQELTDRLYNEGLSKGKAEGEAILQSAKAEAEQILVKAREDAAAIVEAARREAADYRNKVEADLRMASAQVLQQTRTDIENIVVASSTAPAKAVLAEPDFVKGIIRTVAERFSAEESQDLEVVLPESLKEQVGPYVQDELGKLLGKEVKASFTKKISGGFTIGPKDGGYFISFSDETFAELIGAYLRPATRSLLFG